MLKEWKTVVDSATWKGRTVKQSGGELVGKKEGVLASSRRMLARGVPSQFNESHLL